MQLKLLKFGNKHVDSYRSLLDFISAETMPRLLNLCLRYYEDEDNVQDFTDYFPPD